MRWGWTLSILMMLAGLVPLTGPGLATVVAGLAGCHLHERVAWPCPIAGVDVGGTLHALGMTGWLFFLTAPIALAGCCLGIALAVLTLVRRARD